MNFSPARLIAVVALASTLMVFRFGSPARGTPGFPELPALATSQDDSVATKSKTKAIGKVDAEEEPAEISAIRQTLSDYIEGSTQGQPGRLRTAFHEKLNLYSIKEGRLSIWAGTDYIANTKEGSSTGERGRILSIDFENDIAVAKVEISRPRRQTYIDYFLMLKIGDDWKIVHKMYTKRNGRSGRVEWDVQPSE